jgi:hypothetical protein
MSNTRGGRRIELIASTKLDKDTNEQLLELLCMEYPYPHSQSAKTNGIGQPFPLFRTEYHRPSKTMQICLDNLLTMRILDLSTMVKIIGWEWLNDKNRHDKMPSNTKV